MNPEEFKKRTKAFGLRIIHLVESLPETRAGRVIGNQLLRAGTSVGANYRAACRTKSRADFISKMGTVEEEAGESLYWLEILVDAELVNQARVGGLVKEGDEILSIVVASINTSRRHAQSAVRNPQSAMP